MIALANSPAEDTIDRAAIMVMLLEEDAASQLLSGLSPHELHTLGSRMCAIGEIGPDAITHALASFAQSAETTGISPFGRTDSVRRIMTSAVGETKADSIMRRATKGSPAPRTPALDLVRWLEPDVLAALVEQEDPQIIAVLLVQLDPVAAAEVLAGLPEDRQSPVVHRVARLGAVSPEAVQILEGVLTARISARHGFAPLALGGVREAAEIINSASRAVEKRVMPAIGKIDKRLARDLEREMFRFEHLFALDLRMMGTLLRDVESDVLIDALKGIDAEARAPFFAAMSSRAADGLRDEIESRGRICRGDAEAAQQNIIAVARRLAEEGAIVLGAGGDDDYV